MPIKKDGTGKRWVEMELLIPGTPEQVWRTMAGDGNAAWFTKADIEDRVGGGLRLDFGQGNVSSGLVTAWEPPHRFGYVEPNWADGAPPVATEITITARAGSQCLIRMVHSLFTSSDDWDDQLEGFENGWPGFFAVLRVYLANFAGMDAASFMAVAGSDADHLLTWKRLLDAFGLAAADVGEHRTASSGPERLTGFVERVHQDAKQRYILLRLDSPGPGVALLGTYSTDAATNVSLCRYFYGDDADSSAAAAEPVWRDWLAKTFTVQTVGA
jgi:uncharacterized protein YndB with AHSA1/START domain